MTVILRADAGPAMGSGHVMRSAALGLHLQRRGHEVSLVSASLPEQVEAWLEDSGISVIPVPPEMQDRDAEVLSSVSYSLGAGDWVVVDHYGRDRDWELSVDRGAARLCVIDDLADRPHHCDVLIDVGMHSLVGDPYRGLVPPGAELLLGPGYALLRPEFDGLSPRERSGSVERILISLGGGARVAGELVKLMAALETLPRPRPEVRVLRDVSLAPVVDSTADLLPEVTFLDFSKDMPGLLTWADLVVGTCGGASWERCLLGVPAVVCLTADNQRDDVEGLERAGAVISVGDAEATGSDDWSAALSVLLTSPGRVREMGRAAADVMRDRASCLERLDGLLAARDE